MAPQSSLVGRYLREGSATAVLVGFDGGILSYFLVFSSMWRAIASSVTVAAELGDRIGDIWVVNGGRGNRLDLMPVVGLKVVRPRRADGKGALAYLTDGAVGTKLYLYLR